MVVFIGGQFADFLKVEVQIWLLALLAGLKAIPAPNRAPQRRQGNLMTKAGDVRLETDPRARQESRKTKRP